MAVSFLKAKNDTKVFSECVKALAQAEAGNERTIDGRKKRCWLSVEDAPSGAADAGMLKGDFILHIGAASTTRDFYIYEGGTTYTKVNG